MFFTVDDKLRCNTTVIIGVKQASHTHVDDKLGCKKKICIRERFQFSLESLRFTSKSDYSSVSRSLVPCKAYNCSLNWHNELYQ